MNWDSIEGNWKDIMGQVRTKWGALTDDDLTAVAGKRDQLAVKLQDRYGYSQDRAEMELDDFSSTLVGREVPGARNSVAGGVPGGRSSASGGLCLSDSYRAMCAMNTEKGEMP